MTVIGIIVPLRSTESCYMILLCHDVIFRGKEMKSFDGVSLRALVKVTRVRAFLRTVCLAHSQLRGSFFHIRPKTVIQSRDRYPPSERNNHTNMNDRSRLRLRCSRGDNENSKYVFYCEGNRHGGERGPFTPYRSLESESF